MSAVWCLTAAVKAAIATGVVDPKRIGLQGHSWGGYQTAFTVTQTDLFAAAVAGAPLTNMVSMYSLIYKNSGGGNMAIFESSQGRFLGGYWDNWDAYYRNSPVNFAKNVKTPLVILHNDKDGAVDFTQGVEYYNTLRRLGKPVVMLEYPGENHGLAQAGEPAGLHGADEGVLRPPPDGQAGAGLVGEGRVAPRDGGPHQGAARRAEEEDDAREGGREEVEIPMACATKTALITGASAGIGAALARVFAAQRLRPRADRAPRPTGSRPSRRRLARRTAGRSASSPPTWPIPRRPSRLFDEVTRAGITIDALVNNAGYGLPGGLLHSSWDQHRDFIQVMVTAIAELCYRFAPGMVERQRGWIINVGSVAGLVPGSAGHTLYGAVKSLVIKFSQSLALELRPEGVHVTALCPGFTYSEFHDVNGMRPTVSQLPKWMWMDADTVAQQGYDAVMRGDIVCVNGAWNKTLVTLVRYTPDWLVNAVLKKFAKKFRRV